ncbi:MAG: hypothetical protein E3K32_05205 [wastewater metagenome]|nr:hypothetical protein [Candidatus Loosdrechtia aerotolerans]
MNIFSKKRRVKKEDKNFFLKKGEVVAPEQGTETDTSSRKKNIYPGIELEDYYLYYLQDPLKDTVAVRARVLYITRRELLFEVSGDEVVSEVQHDNQDSPAEQKPAVPAVNPVFVTGNNISLKLQIPFLNDFVRATGRILGVEYHAPNNSTHVRVAYTKILGSDNEILFNTILDMLMG